MSEQLTFADVVTIVEGHVLGGNEGLAKPLHKYVIGAMKEQAMARYIDAGSLLIVGNREGCAFLGTGAGCRRTDYGWVWYKQGCKDYGR